ncbi:unnamed protein product, partial [Mesorhabditis belari]|uniref:Selenoprotein F n=1 Tax=Mesorhabditis belari TaxID=2138241 RepID=A0AAF3ETR1_9BILA
MILLCLLLAVVTAQQVQNGIEMTADECKEAGFISSSLKCSVCESLPTFNLDHLVTDCQACCTKEKEAEHEKFPLAHVEVCECNLARFPQVQAFVHQNMADQFGDRVKVRHVRGVRPQIVLKDLKGITRQTLNIEKWDTNTIIDFLVQWTE